VLLSSVAHAAQFVLNGMLAAFLPLYGREVLNLSGAELGWRSGCKPLPPSWCDRSSGCFRIASDAER
jgi:hypothetical protein